MEFKQVTQWAEEHPLATAGIVFVGGLGLLWVFGFFNRSGSADNGSANMAAAYYAAEAQQAVVGGQIQQTTLTTAAATKQAEIQANAATSIASIQATTDQSIATSQYSTAQALGLAGFQADVTKAGYSAQTAQTLAAYSADTSKTLAAYSADVAKTGAYYNYALGVTQSNDARATAESSNYYNNRTAEAGFRASELNTALNTIVPQELAYSGGFGNFVLPDLGYFTVNTGAYHTPTELAAQGYTTDAIAQITAQQVGSLRFR